MQAGGVHSCIITSYTHPAARASPGVLPQPVITTSVASLAGSEMFATGVVTFAVDGLIAVVRCAVKKDVKRAAMMALVIAMRAMPSGFEKKPGRLSVGKCASMFSSSGSSSSFCVPSIPETLEYSCPPMLARELWVRLELRRRAAMRGDEQLTLCAQCRCSYPRTLRKCRVCGIVVAI